MDRRELLLGAALLGVAAEAKASALPRAIKPASSAFWRRWGDGKAELASYRGTTMRYGAPRECEVVLITVTEPHDRARRVKDDAAKDPVQVLKLNLCERFLTGIYPYSVMTSVFCPVDHFAEERFSPSKLTLTAQEWCGHVFMGVWPERGEARTLGASYFASEGDLDARMDVPEGALYEDALWIQLRELDGPFAGGSAWSGTLVPSLWSNRKAHEPLVPVDAKITRTALEDRTRFELSYGRFRRSYDVERAGERRLLGWATSDGGKATLVASERLAYWAMNGPDGVGARARLGLPDR